MGYAGGTTPVKQFYTEASGRLATAIGGATYPDGVVMLKGVTINPSGTGCHIRIYDGSTTGGTKIYEQKLGDEAVYQEYISASGIRCKSGIYIELVAGTTSVAVIWQ